MPKTPADAALPLKPNLSLPQTIKPGLEAMGRCWRPFVMLQGMGLLLVAGYFFAPGWQPVLNLLGEWKTRGGLGFTIAASIFAGALLPEMIKIIVRDDRGLNPPGRLLFLCLLFACNGILVEGFYSTLQFTFGPTTDLKVLVVKVICDQLLFTPLLALPFGLTMMAWMNRRFQFHADNNHWRPTIWWRHVPPVLLPCWTYWMPMVALIFCLPQPLQFPMFALALAAWSLVFVFIATRNAETESDSTLTHPSLSAS